jgi:hypothetical protein
MNAGIAGVPLTDPFATLREYAKLAPWSLRDLTALCAAILEASGVYPINAAARARPTERTIRFYVSRGLVSPPEGRGTAAIYSYRHLLQVLAIKLRQMEGVTLDAIIKEFAGMAGDVVERRVATALGAALPAPERLQLMAPHGAPRGKVRRAMQSWSGTTPPQVPGFRSAVCRRFGVAPGVELVVDEHHPLFRLGLDESEVANRFREAVAALLAHARPIGD